MHYHIILTEKCNSRCRYCYEKSMKEFENGLEKKWNFDLEAPVDSEISIEKLKSFLQPSDTLIFYGGEPLVNFDKMKEIMDALPKQRFCMQTNGKLLNKIPKKYINKLSRILVSIDGNKERTDYNRGVGTHDAVFKNIGLIRKNGYKGEIVARMVISFPDIFEQVKHLIDSEKFDSIHWQIDAGFYKNDFDEKEFSKFVKEYNRSIKELLDYWVEEMKKDKVLKLYPFVGIFNRLSGRDKETRLHCGSGFANYTITTNGNLVACPIMGCVKDFYCGDLDSSRLKEIYVGEPCTSCDYLNICGGRCLYSNYAKLWPPEGEKLICKTITFLIDVIREKIPEIKELIEKKVINEKDFDYEKYFGPEIIP